MTTATLVVRHLVTDYAEWRAVYEETEPLRQQYGCIAKEVMTAPDDQNDVFVLHRFPTIEQARGFADSAELHEAMGRAGVLGAPRIEFAVSV
jgi:hypothetical protein